MPFVEAIGDAAPEKFSWDRDVYKALLWEYTQRQLRPVMPWVEDKDARDAGKVKIQRAEKHKFEQAFRSMSKENLVSLFCSEGHWEHVREELRKKAREAKLFSSNFLY